MFYSQFILAKKGPLGTIWIAAHLERKLRKNQVADTDIGISVDSIICPEVPIALRLSSHLLLGVVRIYSRKVNYLFHDCSEALLKIKQAFRSTAVDLPPEESTAPYHSITLPETFDLDDFELPDAVLQGNFVDHHVSTKEQITLQDKVENTLYTATQFGLDERFADGDTSHIGLELDEELFLKKGASLSNTSHPSENLEDQLCAPPETPFTPFAGMDIDDCEEDADGNKNLENSTNIPTGCDLNICQPNISDERMVAGDSSSLQGYSIRTPDLNETVIPYENIRGPGPILNSMNVEGPGHSGRSVDLLEPAQAPSTPGLIEESVPVHLQDVPLGHQSKTLSSNEAAEMIIDSMQQKSGYHDPGNKADDPSALSQCSEIRLRETIDLYRKDYEMPCGSLHKEVVHDQSTSVVPNNMHVLEPSLLPQGSDMMLRDAIGLHSKDKEYGMPCRNSGEEVLHDQLASSAANHMHGLDPSSLFQGSDVPTEEHIDLHRKDYGMPCGSSQNDIRHGELTNNTQNSMLGPHPSLLFQGSDMPLSEAVDQHSNEENKILHGELASSIENNIHAVERSSQSQGSGVPFREVIDLHRKDYGTLSENAHEEIQHDKSASSNRYNMHGIDPSSHCVDVPLRGTVDLHQKDFEVSCGSTKKEVLRDEFTSNTENNLHRLDSSSLSQSKDYGLPCGGANKEVELSGAIQNNTHRLDQRMSFEAYNATGNSEGYLKDMEVAPSTFSLCVDGSIGRFTSAGTSAINEIFPMDKPDLCGVSQHKSAEVLDPSKSGYMISSDCPLQPCHSNGQINGIQSKNQVIGDDNQRLLTRTTDGDNALGDRGLFFGVQGKELPSEVLENNSILGFRSTGNATQKNFLSASSEYTKPESLMVASTGTHSLLGSREQNIAGNKLLEPERSAQIYSSLVSTHGLMDVRGQYVSGRGMLEPDGSALMYPSPSSTHGLIDIREQSVAGTRMLEPGGNAHMYSGISSSHHLIDSRDQFTAGKRTLEHDVNAHTYSSLGGREHYSEPERIMLASTSSNFLLSGFEQPITGRDGNAHLYHGMPSQGLSFGEATPVLFSGSSVKSPGLPRSKRKASYVPGDDDLLASILVERKRTTSKAKDSSTLLLVPSSKRPRLNSKQVTPKRKVLIDDTMVLHADTIRQQLMNTDDTRRMRKKAPCTRHETWLLQKLLLEEEIFCESVLTGMSPELTSIHYQICNPNGNVYPRVDSSHSPMESSKTALSKDVAVTSTGFVELGNSDVACLEKDATGTPVHLHSHLGSGTHHKPSHVSSMYDVDQMMDVQEDRSPPGFSSADIARSAITIEAHDNESIMVGKDTKNASSVAIAPCSMTHLPLLEKDNDREASTVTMIDEMISNPSCGSLEQEKDASAPVENSCNVKDGVHESEGRVVMHGTGKDAEAVVAFSEEKKDAFDVPAVNAYSVEAAINDSEGRVSVHDMGKDIEAAVVVTEEKCLYSEPVPVNDTLDYGSSIETVKNTDGFPAVLENRSVVMDGGHLACVATANEIETGQQQIDNSALDNKDLSPFESLQIFAASDNLTSTAAEEFGTHNADLGNDEDEESSAHDAILDADDDDDDDDVHGNFSGHEMNPDMDVHVGNAEGAGTAKDPCDLGSAVDENDHDTAFLNMDDEVDFDEEVDFDIPNTAEDRSHENSGWSTRTRGVARYLKLLFDEETGYGRKDAQLDRVLSGKTRKEASRMFFETLVLKTKDYIHVEQDSAFGSIKIEPRSKLLKTTL